MAVTRGPLKISRESKRHKDELATQPHLLRDCGVHLVCESVYVGHVTAWTTCTHRHMANADGAHPAYVFRCFSFSPCQASLAEILLLSFPGIVVHFHSSDSRN
ncbi:hypothetical protein V6Z11_D08G155400 [Gossypium hirsutum]